ncbi:MAG: hypothetical protein ACI8P9_004459 [Parasphingorhabdus sp.]|jgi:hypothetical protein
MKIFWPMIVALSLLIAGCGGSGGSSSGNPTTSGQDTSALAGMYKGTAVLIARIAGQSGDSDVTVSILITPNGQIRISFDNRVEFLGAITKAGGYSISGSIKRLGLSQCRGIITASGNVIGSQVNGSITSRNVKCNLISGSLRGSFTASKI